MAHIQEIKFLIPVDNNCRRRHVHKRIKNEIIYFMIQLEVFIDNKWFPVVRYDTAHRYAHRDIIHYNGLVEKMVVFSQTYNEAIDIAESDLKTNWSIYKERFLKEAQNND